MNVIFSRMRVPKVVLRGFMAAALFVTGRVFLRPICVLDNTRATFSRVQIRAFLTALEAYRKETDHFPTTSEGLSALRRPPVGIKNWAGPYLTNDIAPDPWGHAYLYRFPGEHGLDRPEIVSYGADGRRGGRGRDSDIESWRLK